MMMNDFKRALYDFSGAILNQSKNSQKQPKVDKAEGLSTFYLHGGQCNYYLGQYEEALAHYNIAIEKNDASNKRIVVSSRKSIIVFFMMLYL